MAISYRVSEIKRLIVILDKYFGVGVGYFGDIDLQLLLMKDSLTEEEDVVKEFNQYIEGPEFVDLWNDCLGEFDDKLETEIYCDALFFLANIVHSKPYYGRKKSLIDNAIYDEVLYQTSVRKELLQLYIFVNRKTDNVEDRLTIKCHGRNLTLNNSFGWFTERMVNYYMSQYLPDIATVEDAKRELKSYNRKVGLKIEDERIPAIIYGLYYLLHDVLLLKKKLPLGICKFIHGFLKLVGCTKQELVDPINFRADIRYFVESKTPHRFHYNKVQKGSMDLLANAGKKQF